MNGIDTLRLILFVAGMVIIAAVYWSGRRGKRRNRAAVARVEPTARRHSAIDDLDLDADEGVGEVTIMRRKDMEEALDEPGDGFGPLVADRDDEALPIEPPNSPAPRKKTTAVESKLIVLYVVAQPGSCFTGPDIAREVEAVGLSYGKHRIYHRHYLNSEPLYSLANMVEPGVFDLTHWDDFMSPGLTLFTSLPGPLGGLIVFEAMLDAARRLAAGLCGEVRDRARNPLSPATIERLRGEIAASEASNADGGG